MLPRQGRHGQRQTLRAQHSTTKQMNNRQKNIEEQKRIAEMDREQPHRGALTNEATSMDYPPLPQLVDVS